MRKINSVDIFVTGFEYNLSPFLAIKISLLIDIKIVNEDSLGHRFGRNKNRRYCHP